MKRVFVLLCILILYIGCCTLYRESFLDNDQISYMLLLRESDPDMLFDFNNYSKNYTAFDLSNSTNKTNFMNSNPLIVSNIGSTVFDNTLTRGNSYHPSYLQLTPSYNDKQEITNVTMGSTISPNLLVNQPYVYFNGMMLQKQQQGTTWSWSIMASEVSKNDITYLTAPLKTK